MSVSPKGNGKWVVNLSLNSKRVNKTFDSRIQAENYFDFIEKFVSGKRIIQYSRTKEAQLGKMFYEMNEYDLANGIISEGSHFTYTSTFYHAFKDGFENVLLHEIDNDFISKLRERMKSRNASPRANGTSFNLVMIILKKIRKYVFNNHSEILNIPNSTILNPVQISKKEIKPYTKEEFLSAKAEYNKLEDGDEKYFASIFLLNIQIGLRIGELLALTWGDIDYNQKTIIVSKTLQNTAQGKKVSSSTKNHISRTVSVSDFCIELLNYIKEHGAKRFKELKSGEQVDSKKEFVFRSVSRIRHKPIATSSLTGWFQKMPNILKIRYLSSHASGRKSMATMLAKDLVSKQKDPFAVAKALQKRLGHKNYSTTLENYIVPATIDDEDMFDVFSGKDVG